MCVGKTLNMDSCSKFWGNLEGIWGNTGEIPRIGCKIPGVYSTEDALLNGIMTSCLGKICIYCIRVPIKSVGMCKQKPK